MTSIYPSPCSNPIYYHIIHITKIQRAFSSLMWHVFIVVWSLKPIRQTQHEQKIINPQVQHQSSTRKPNIIFYTNVFLWHFMSLKRSVHAASIQLSLVCLNRDIILILLIIIIKQEWQQYNPLSSYIHSIQNKQDNIMYCYHVTKCMVLESIHETA